jgi:AIR synthase-related protein
MNVSEMVEHLRGSRGFAHKRDISSVSRTLSMSLPQGWQQTGHATGLGDDCAALADGDGYLLFAIEGLVQDFIERMPWFAGYCAIMANVSDIYAMGGRPLAVVDALWSRGMDPADKLLEGMAAASVAYGVPIVGGHSNNRSEHGQLAVAIVGRARTLLSSFNARSGDVLIMAIDLRGAYQEPFPYWNASTESPGARLRDDLDILPTLAERSLCDAGKDISMAGAVGTVLMMLECSQQGAAIDLDAIVRPDGVPLERWLTSFPSFGFVLSVRPSCAHAVLAAFEARDIAASVCGSVIDGGVVHVTHDNATATLWDFGVEPFMLAPTRTVATDRAS